MDELSRVECTEPVTLGGRPEEPGTWKFFFIWWDEEAKLWARGSGATAGFPTYEDARTLFWTGEDPRALVLCGSTPADVPDEDHGSVWADSEMSPDERARLLAGYDPPLNAEWFTVFAAWDTGDGLRPYVDAVVAATAAHAELLVREKTGGGDLQVAAVVAGDWTYWTSQEQAQYPWGTPDGQPLAEEEPTPVPAEPPVRTLVAAAVVAAVGAVLLAVGMAFDVGALVAADLALVLVTIGLLTYHLRTRRWR